MCPLLWLDLVGLTPRMIGTDTPHLAALAARGAMAPMTTVLPAVTCSVQASLLTGLSPQEHGAVGNGWLDPVTREVALWRQANQLVSGEKVYEAARPLLGGKQVAKLFWWWNMGADVDLSVTPRPFYPADGRKIAAIYSWPTEYGAQLERELGPFPFFDFWGPKSGLPSSRWIADATIRTMRERAPGLVLAYLPHLDYDLQRYGPNDERSQRAVRELDGLVGQLVQAADAGGYTVVATSEYGITEVDQPVDVNRALRRAGLLVARETPTGDRLDVFGSKAFALADHQLAHVYTKNAESTAAAAEVLRALPGVESVHVGPERAALGLDHPRAGELVAIAKPRAWFTYYYWLDDAGEPDFARTVDIHNKPGYDPCELFVDPKLKAPMLRVARRLAQKKLGMRYLMDVVPTDPTLVRGSHGRLPDDPLDGPVFLCSRPFAECGGEPDGPQLDLYSVKSRVLRLLEDRRR
ncbi:MAG: alkaline phosphatase family protein [Planctomycetes bacterium]|nr:alkaline phosphatase family protein [Planctomycetota bacterium]MCB9904539.1 alkaline phosphatase family protein [Planctomycetota bacterium]